MKQVCVLFILSLLVAASYAQDSTQTKINQKNSRKEVRRQKINTLIKQAEEGVLVYRKQSIFGIQLRTNGYGGFYEFGKMKTPRRTTIFRLDINESKNQKEEKLSGGNFFSFGNSFIYGKINYFYPTTLGIGQQLMLGQKGNKNGVAVSAVYSAGISLGLLRPYYLDVQDSAGGNKSIKYTPQDSSTFVSGPIIGASGFSKGWGEISLKPGAFAKAALRFDYGRFNETVAGIEAGISVEAYANKIPIMLYQKDKQIFFQGYVSLLFGRRK